jgi:hypothetical protein
MMRATTFPSIEVPRKAAVGGVKIIREDIHLCTQTFYVKPSYIGQGKDAIRKASPRIDERKRGHVYDDADRTTRYVLLDPDVERERGETSHSANRERDHWF